MYIVSWRQYLDAVLIAGRLLVLDARLQHELRHGVRVQRRRVVRRRQVLQQTSVCLKCGNSQVSLTWARLSILLSMKDIEIIIKFKRKRLNMIQHL